jgi:hypothetical protein
MASVINLLDDRRIPFWPRRGPLMLRIASGVVTLVALAQVVLLLAVPWRPVIGGSTARPEPVPAAQEEAAGPSLTLATLAAALLDLEARAARSGDRDVRLLRSLQVESRQGGGSTRELSLRLELARDGGITVDDVLVVLSAAGASGARTVRTSPTPGGDLVELVATAVVAAGWRPETVAGSTDARHARIDRRDDPLLELVAIVSDHDLRLTSARTVRSARGDALMVEANGEPSGVRAFLDDLENDFSAPTRIQRFVLTAAVTSNTFDVLLVLTPRETPAAGPRVGGTRR